MYIGTLVKILTRTCFVEIQLVLMSHFNTTNDSLIEKVKYLSKVHKKQ